METGSTKKQLEDGDFLVMMSDGVLEYLQEEDADLAMCGILQELSEKHPGQLADAVLKEVLERTGGKAADDMTILVCGVCQFFLPCVRHRVSYNNERDFQLLRQAESFMRQHQMTEPGSHVIAGVSGGADSICMLLVLLHLRDVFKYEVSVVHVEHGIRGEAAHKDAAFVSSFCRASGIECHIRHFQVPEYARAHGMSEEEAGR